MSDIAAKRLSDEQCREFVEGYVVIRRWGLDHFVDPSDEVQVARELNRLRDGDHSIFAKDLRYQDGEQYEPHIDPGHLTPITMYVDLHQPDTYLKENFLQKLRDERTNRNIITRRDKQSQVDIWQVWDLREAHKNDFREIASVLCGESGDPVRDENAKKVCDRLQDAFHKAVRMIKEVGDSRNKSVSYEVVEVSLVRDIKELFQQVNRIRA